MELAAAGKDVNQIAALLCGDDPDGHNYGIGIMLAGNGKPMSKSAMLMAKTCDKLTASTAKYYNSAAFMESLKGKILAWQGIPEKYWDSFVLALPSDSGTGAVVEGLRLILMDQPGLHTGMTVEEMGWPAYQAMALTNRLGFEKIEVGGVVNKFDEVPVYQAGPHNSMGVVVDEDVWKVRANMASEFSNPPLLDRAYSAFEFAQLATDNGLAAAMDTSYRTCLAPFIETEVACVIAIGGTKCFRTFDSRSCGFLLVYQPDEDKRFKWTKHLSALIRARGSAFEHPVTRALVSAMVDHFNHFENLHMESLERVAQAESAWKRHAAGTPLAKLFGSNYGGIFRTFPIIDDAAEKLYEQHIYPVIAGNIGRINVTGIPDNEALATTHIAALAEVCDL